MCIFEFCDFSVKQKILKIKKKRKPLELLGFIYSVSGVDDAPKTGSG